MITLLCFNPPKTPCIIVFCHFIISRSLVVLDSVGFSSWISWFPVIRVGIVWLPGDFLDSNASIFASISTGAAIMHTCLALSYPAWILWISLVLCCLDFGWLGCLLVVLLFQLLLFYSFSILSVFLARLLTCWVTLRWKWQKICTGANMRCHSHIKPAYGGTLFHHRHSFIFSPTSLLPLSPSMSSWAMRWRFVARQSSRLHGGGGATDGGWGRKRGVAGEMVVVVTSMSHQSPSQYLIKNSNPS